jgi:hypothetical protein
MQTRYFVVIDRKLQDRNSQFLLHSTSSRQWAVRSQSRAATSMNGLRLFGDNGCVGAKLLGTHQRAYTAIRRPVGHWVEVGSIGLVPCRSVAALGPHQVSDTDHPYAFLQLRLSRHPKSAWICLLRRGCKYLAAVCSCCRIWTTFEFVSGSQYVAPASISLRRFSSASLRR